MLDRVRARLQNLNPFHRLSGRVDRLSEALAAQSINTHYTLVGLFVVSWATIEISLDYASWITVHLIPGGGGLSSELPRALDRKIGLFQAAHDLAPIADLKDAADKLVVRLQSMKDRRHDIVHGHGSDDLGKGYQYARLHLKGAHMKWLKRVYTRKQLSDLCEDVSHLSGDLAFHVGLIGERFFPKD